MNETETYIANEIRLRVWSGLTNADDVQDVITDILEDGADEAMLRALVAIEFARKAEAEKTWPAETDCDKLIRAFKALREKGVISIHNAGWDKSEAFHNCLEEYRRHSTPDSMFGICYYTSQDIDGAIDGHSMYIGYSSTRPETEETDAVRAGALICAELNNTGLTTDWGGEAKSRIKLEINWQRRGSP
jgi:hypothetical protein